MTFYVYKATGRLSKNVWELVSELDHYDAAVAAAEKLCPRGGKIEAEPGNGLPKAYPANVISRESVSHRPAS